MAPADPARSLGDLAAGSRVRILGESAGWNRCALPDGGEGWIISKGIERIAPPQ
jgi:SH3-like domain-containing protein